MNESLRMLFAIACLVFLSIQCMAKTLDAPMDKEVLSELDQANELYLNDAKELKEYYSELKESQIPSDMSMVFKRNKSLNRRFREGFLEQCVKLFTI